MDKGLANRGQQARQRSQQTAVPALASGAGQPAVLAAHVHALQRTAGNRAVASYLRTLATQSPTQNAPGHDEGGPRRASTISPTVLIGARAHPLQQIAKNHAVPALQRAPATARRHAPAQPETPEDYTDLLYGINHLRNAAFVNQGNHEAQLKALGAVEFGEHLTPRHRSMLVNLRTALILAYSSAPGSHQQGLALWTSIEGDFSFAMRRAPEFVDGDIGAVQQDLNDLSEKVIRPAAYYEAHDDTVAHSGLKSPDLVFQQQELDKAEKNFELAQQLAEEVGKLTSQGVAQMVMGKSGPGKEIFELMNLRGTIEEKLEWAKGKGLLAKTATGADLVSKVLGGANAVVTISIEVGKDYAERQAKQALAREAEHLAKQWEAIAKGWEEKLKTLEKVGKVLGVIGIAADVLRTVRAILRHDWGEAVKEAGSAVVDTLGVFGAEGSGALLGGIVVTIHAEIEAIHMAAAFIRWCRDENVRQAAGSFIEACDKVAKSYAFDFVADVDMLLDPSKANLSDIVGKQLTLHSANMKKGLAYIGNQLNSNAATSLGGQPQLIGALGPAAVHAISNPFDTPDDPLTLAQQIRDLFAGANAMARFVRDNYPTGDKKEEKSEGGEAQEE